MTWPLALLIAAVSLSGIVNHAIYRGEPVWTIQAVAQDYADLLAVLPILVASSLWASRRGSFTGWLVWLGALSYIIYTFVLYVFAVAHNSLFLAYVAVFGLAVWGLCLGLVTTDWSAVAAPNGRRRRWVAGYLIVLAVLFYVLWLAEEVPSIATGVPPASVVAAGLATNPVHVLDLAIMLPAMLMTGALLWRNHVLGPGVAIVILVNVLLQNVAIALMMTMSIRAGLPGEVALAGFFVVMAVVSLTVLRMHVGALETRERG